MNVSKTNLSDSQVKLNIVVPVDFMKPFLERAAKKLSLKHSINGFRPGKASYDIIKQNFGEMTIYQEALNPIIDHTLIDASKQENLDFVGSPKIEVEKLAPDNDLVYIATVDLMPSAELPNNWKELSITVKKEKVKPENVKSVIDDLAKKQSKQILKNGASILTDKVVLDFELSFDHVVPDGGVAKNFEIVLGEKKMIEGFEEALVGLSANDKKEFELTFPDNYFRKEFAGKKGLFKITMNHVFTMETPKLDDEFVKTYGYKNYEEFSKKIEEQLQHELDHNNEHEAEVKMFELLMDKVKFSTIPESMIEAEKDTMIHELEHNITKQGLKFEDYLQNIKKSVDELKKEFSPDALKRVKSGLILKTIREVEKIDVSDDEVAQEVEKTIESMKENTDMKKYMQEPRYKMYVKNSLAIRKVTKLMKDLLLKR